MEINRHNYEEFFLLYVDNELSPAERTALHQFLEQNPDLKPELEALQNTVLHSTGNDTVFPNIQSLLKSESNQTINESNCEEYFVLYTDNELNNNERALVEDFVKYSPQYQSAFQLLQSTKLQADESIVFRNKKILYKHKGSVNAIYTNLIKWSVAAAIIIIAGIFWFTQNKTSTPSDNQIAFNPTQHLSGDTRVTTALPQTNELKNNTPENTVTQKETNRGYKEVLFSDKNKSKPVKTNSITTMPPEIKPAKNNDGNVNNKQNNFSAHIKLKATSIEPLQENEIVRTSVKLAGKIQENNTLQMQVQTKLTDANNDNDDKMFFANTENNKKPNLREILRKAGRIIERNTNVDSDERSTILIGNFAIATK